MFQGHSTAAGRSPTAPRKNGLAPARLALKVGPGEPNAEALPTTRPADKVGVRWHLVVPILEAHDRGMRSGVALLVVGLTLVLAAPAAAVSPPASAGVVAFSPTASAAVPALYDNCTNFHKKYRHGVGRAGARDKTRSGAPGVTTFLRSTRIYNIAMKWNDDLDRDNDGVACEKR